MTPGQMGTGCEPQLHLPLPLQGLNYTYTNTHTHLTAPFLGLPASACTRKVEPIWILLEQETVSGSSISWAICKSAPSSRQITTPAPHHSLYNYTYTSRSQTFPMTSESTGAGCKPQLRRGRCAILCLSVSFSWTVRSTALYTHRAHMHSDRSWWNSRVFNENSCYS